MALLRAAEGRGDDVIVVGPPAVGEMVLLIGEPGALPTSAGTPEDDQ